ncbi:hypothetical protein PROFUN_16452 [Planoprotostelium fungivorum]|uniref:Uncharacterized protein n=1 Tax=Planoprotostelium fungivorum TaxID=1890364 RepID=A0A2P6MQL3_9EUKA|nr:hypothetical protein PROFUN_16452 [Planoprotostelium fungivorum]
MDSGTPHYPSLPLSTYAQMSRRIAIVPQFTYISFATFFSGLPTGLQSSKLSLDKTYDRLSPNSPNLSLYSSQQGVNSPPPMDSGTPHHPSLPLSTYAQMSRRIAIVPQFAYISFATFFLGLPTGLQSSKLSVGQQWLRPSSSFQQGSNIHHGAHNFKHKNYTT